MAGVGLVVASSTLVSDFEGWIGIGTAFAMALLMAFVINLLLGLSAAELAVTYPRAGALYDYGTAAFGGKGAKAAITGIFLGFSFYAMFAFVGALETNAGAFGLRALFVSDDLSILEESLLPWIIGMTVLAVIPNLLGIQILARVELLVVVVMLAIRWIFGLFGYFGAGNTGGWSAGNWDAGLSMWDWFGAEGVIAAGLIIAIWSFIGIEFVGPLAEETKDPGRMIPKGIGVGPGRHPGHLAVHGLRRARHRPDHRLAGWAGRLRLRGELHPAVRGTRVLGRRRTPPDGGGQRARHFRLDDHRLRRNAPASCTGSPGTATSSGRSPGCSRTCIPGTALLGRPSS